MINDDYDVYMHFVQPRIFLSGLFSHSSAIDLQYIRYKDKRIGVLIFSYICNERNKPIMSDVNLFNQIANR
ncbi:hypothetical protein DERP_007670 [Dermatophagoides pteronyssinus]|uniref:Uncharacterized protein n=1 Tax=Dermatophagoides pteronyssinus TaxID=6956 RepID=A0ABQ8JKE5_DERPT|nr:hypothetical protein DERP_007670 [Dermatophagoides pteronyssinus]